MGANEEEIGASFIEDLEEERRQNEQAEQAEELVDTAGNVIDDAAESASESVSETVDRAQDQAQSQQSSGGSTSSQSGSGDTRSLDEVTTEPADDDSVETGGSGPEVTDAQQQNINAAIQEDVPDARNDAQGVETRDDRVGEQAEQLEREVVAERADLDPNDVRVTRDGDMLRTELTATGRETLGVNPTAREQRDRARERIAEQNQGVSQDDLTNVRVEDGQVSAELTDEARTERDAAQNFERNVRRERLQDLASVGDDLAPSTTSDARPLSRAATGAGAVAGEFVDAGLSAASARDESGLEFTSAADVTQTRTGQRGAAEAVASDPTFQPILSADQTQQRAGQRGAVQAISASQERGGSERVARGADAPRQPRDLGDDVVPQEVEGFINRNRRRVQSGVQGTLDATGGIQQPTVIPTSDGLQLVGVGTEPTAVERGLGDTTTAPFDAATAATEGTETAAFALEGSPLAGGSQAEQADRVDQIGDEAAFFAQRTARGAQQNPERFGAALAGEAIAGGLAAGALRGGAGAGLTTATRQTVSASRRGISNVRRVDSLAEARARTPSIRVTRDPDAGLIESDLNLAGRLRNRVARGRDTDRPPQFPRDRDTGSDLATDIRFSVGELRRRLDDRLAPEPRRGGDFAVDASVTGGTDIVSGLRDRLTRSESPDRPPQFPRDRDTGSDLATDIRFSVGELRRRLDDRLAPEPRRGGEFAVDGSTGASAVAERLTTRTLDDGTQVPRGAGALLSADAALRNLRTRLSGEFAPEPRRGGEFAVDASTGASSVVERLTTRTLDDGTQVPRGAGLLLSAEAALRRSRDSRPRQFPRDRDTGSDLATDIRFSVGELRRRLDDRLAPEPRRGGDFAVDASVTGGTDIVTGLRNRISQSGDGPGIRDTTIRIRPGRPARRSRTPDADLFEFDDADSLDALEIEGEGNTTPDRSAGDGSSSRADGDEQSGGTQSSQQETVVLERSRTDRTGTGTDPVATRGLTLDAGAGAAIGLSEPQSPTVDADTASTPGVAGGTEPTSTVGQPQADETTPTAGAGLDLGGRLGGGLGFGSDLDLGAATSPELDFRGEAQSRTQQPTGRRANVRVPGRFAGSGLATGQATTPTLVQQVDQQQRTRNRTRRPGGPRRPRVDLGDETRSPGPGDGDLALGGPGEPGEDDIAPGFLAETFTGLALFPGEQSAEPAAEAELEAAAEAGAFSGELPTAELLDPSEEQAEAFAATGATLGVDL